MPYRRLRIHALSRKHEKKAFTLIEVMTATVIMIIIITFSLKIAVDTAAIYDAGMSSLKTASEARVVLNALTQDFESAVVKNDGNIWIEINHAEAVANIPASAAPEIMLFAPDPERRKRLANDIERIPGTICAIKYKIAHRSPFDNPGDYIQQIYVLYRAGIDSQGTYGMPNSAANSPLQNVLAGKTPEETWRGSAEVLDAAGVRSRKALPTWVTDIQNYKATGIASLSLVFYFQNNVTQKLEALAHDDIGPSLNDSLRNAQVPEVTVNTYKSNVQFKAGKIIVDGTEISGTLRSIEFAVTVLSPDGDRAVRALQKQGNSPKINQERFNVILRKYGYTFNTTVPISQQ
ncbi:MAG: hypothetical protein LBG65_02965 [Puniceicoccales bacterium]|jgi:competence protein ComGC|nr:hypothetical protein [Puniceicoccales bacterium]